MIANNIIDIARQYFTVIGKTQNTYQIVDNTGNSRFDSVVLFADTNSYFRFSNRMGGGIYEFLKYIVGLDEDELEEYATNPIETNPVLTVFDQVKKSGKTDTGLSISEIVGVPGYNQYIKSRNINEITSEHFYLETVMGDVYIPLYNDNMLRVGSIVRNTKAKTKGERYRTYLVGKEEKPCCWRFLDLQYINKRSVIVLVEGAWSVMRIHQVIKPMMQNIIPIATLGTNLTADLYAYITCPVVSILDNDTGGENVARQLENWVQRGKKVESYIPELGNGNGVAYVDDLSDDELIQLFTQIKSLSNIL